MHYSPSELEHRAIIVAPLLPESDPTDSRKSLSELQELAQQLGYEVVAILTQKLPTTDKRNVLGSGKINELSILTGGRVRHGLSPEDECELYEKVREIQAQQGVSSREEICPVAGTVIFDCDLSDSQINNLKYMTRAHILDRTHLILQIYEQHARTGEARQQVELARLRYEQPCLPIFQMENSGETHSLGAVLHFPKNATAHPPLPEPEPCVALVGFTGSGKSTLMRALTARHGHEALSDDTRLSPPEAQPLFPPTVPRLYITDSVGFLQKSSPCLLSAFHTILRESLSSSLLLCVIDASEPDFRLRILSILSTLRQPDFQHTPMKLIFNKIDLVPESVRTQISQEFPGALLVSFLNPADIARIYLSIIEFFEEQLQDALLCFSSDSYSEALEFAHKHFRILTEQSTDAEVLLAVKGLAKDIRLFESKFGFVHGLRESS